MHAMHLAASLLILTAPVAAQQTACWDLTPLDGQLQQAMTQLSLRGISLRVDQRGATLYQRILGTYGPATVVPIASATKWLSAAVVMALVDEGRIRLDDRVSQYIPSFTGPKAAITIRQCFTHTSGLPVNDASISDDTITLRQAADRIALVPLAYAPGTAFSYGGVSMHVAGACCEVAAGRAWAQLFADKVATPLGMTATDYLAFGPTLNPRIAGGARSSLADYAALVAMLRAGGLFGTRRVLSSAAVAEMFRDHTSGLPVLNSPHPHGAPYGIGTWLDRRDASGRTLQAGGAGAFGFSGWVDLERDVGGVLLVVDRFPEVSPFLDQIEATTWAALQPVGVTCVGASTPACLGPIYVNADRPPRAGDAAFALTGRAAPPSTAGLLLFAGTSDPIGLPVLGVRVHVAVDATLFALPVSSDAGGATRFALSLSGVPQGVRFASQWLWLDTVSCGGLGNLSASQAIDATVLPP